MGGTPLVTIDVVAAGGRADDGQEQHPEDRQADLHTLLARPTIAYQGRENAVMNWNRPSRNSWPLGEGEEVADDPAADQAEGDVGGVGERRRAPRRP